MLREAEDAMCKNCSPYVLCMGIVVWSTRSSRYGPSHGCCAHGWMRSRHDSGRALLLALAMIQDMHTKSIVPHLHKSNQLRASRSRRHLRANLQPDQDRCD